VLFFELFQAVAQHLAVGGIGIHYSAVDLSKHNAVAAAFKQVPVPLFTLTQGLLGAFARGDVPDRSLHPNDPPAAVSPGNRGNESAEHRAVLFQQLNGVFPGETLFEDACQKFSPCFRSGIGVCNLGLKQRLPAVVAEEIHQSIVKIDKSAVQGGNKDAIQGRAKKRPVFLLALLQFAGALAHQQLEIGPPFTLEANNN